MNKNSRIFIAGHNGLVGSAVFRNLKNHGYKNLIVISKKKLDLKNSQKVNLFFKKKKIEYTIICAALAGGIIANSRYPVDFFNENILIQNSLLNASLKFKLKRTIFLGTSCIYPDKAKNPIKENLLLTGKIHQTNEAYAIAKIAGIQLCKALYKQYGLDVVALMPTNIYGINDRYDDEKSHVIPAMILRFLKAKKNNKKIIKIWGDGTPKREFLFSDDLAEAIRIVLNTSKKKLLKLCHNNFPIINIGSGDIYSIKNLANLIKNKVGFKGKVLFDKSYPNGVSKKNLNYERIKKLNWRPKINLNKGLDIILKNEKIKL
jgi:GDP-L-fucose synthase